MVDSAEQLPPASRETLTYLLHNAPANLRVEVAARGDHGLAVADLVTYGQCVVIGTTLLRFRLEETIGLARARFGTRIDADTAAQLHELTEGWPLGLQLALAATGQRPIFAPPLKRHQCAPEIYTTILSICWSRTSLPTMQRF